MNDASPKPSHDVTSDALLSSTLADLDAELKRDFPDAKLRSHTQVTPSLSTVERKDQQYQGLGRGQAYPSGGVSERPRPNFLGAPRSSNILSPLALLNEVTQSTHELHREVRELLKCLTGEEPPQSRAASGLSHAKATLPRVAQLATEIDATHAEIARLVDHMRRQL